MRIAAIDIGTNSIHMIVVQVRPDLSFEVIDREKEMVRLGAGGLDGRSLTPTAMTAALQALSKFRRLAALAQGRRNHRGRDQRDARSRERRRVPRRRSSAQTGIRVRVISGTEEARLIHLAAVYGVDVGGDAGGRHRHRRRQRRGHARHRARIVTPAQSFKLGVIRLTERFVKSDPLVAARRAASW